MIKTKTDKGHSCSWFRGSTTKHYKYSEGEVSKFVCRGIFKYHPISTSFLSCGRCLYPHTEITHTIVSSINKYCQHKLAKRHHNPTIYTLEYTYSNT